MKKGISLRFNLDDVLERKVWDILHSENGVSVKKKLMNIVLCENGVNNIGLTEEDVKFIVKRELKNIGIYGNQTLKTKAQAKDIEINKKDNEIENKNVNKALDFIGSL